MKNKREQGGGAWSREAESVDRRDHFFAMESRPRFDARLFYVCTRIQKRQDCGRVIVDLGRGCVDGGIVPVVEKHLVFCLGIENRIATGVVAK